MTRNADSPSEQSMLAADRPDNLIPAAVLERRPSWASLSHSDVEGIEHMDSLSDALTVLWSTENLSELPEVDAQLIRSDEYHPGTDDYTRAETYGRIYANYKSSHHEMEILEVANAAQARAVAAAALALADAFDRAETDERDSGSRS